jgi:plastocyanin
MQTRILTRLMAIVAVFAVFAVACSSSSSSTPAGGSSSSGGDTVDVTGMTATQVEASNSGSTFSFTPATLTGSAGQSLTITVKNVGSTPHTFTIDGQSVDVEVQPGSQADVTVTFPDSGSVEFYCRFHVGSGMKGSLTVA